MHQTVTTVMQPGRLRFQIPDQICALVPTGLLHKCSDLSEALVSMNTLIISHISASADCIIKL